jgi:uncharacterized membrane protein
MEEHDTNSRSIVKAITWRVIASLTTFILAYIITGELALSAGIGIADVIAKFIFYFLHERAWDRITWGKQISEA